MDLQLTNKKALVTGSTAGIGFAIASLLAQEGAAVVVNGRSPGRVEEAVGRTVWEKTGLLVRPVILTGVYKDMDKGEVALVFRCSLIGNDVDRRVEAAAGRWLTADEVLALMDDASAERLLDAVRLGPPKIRSYNGARLAEH